MEAYRYLANAPFFSTQSLVVHSPRFIPVRVVAARLDDAWSEFVCGCDGVQREREAGGDDVGTQ